MTVFVSRGPRAPARHRLTGAPTFRNRGRSFLLPAGAAIADPLPTRYERKDETMPSRVTVARDRLFHATPEVRRAD